MYTESKSEEIDRVDASFLVAIMLCLCFQVFLIRTCPWLGVTHQSKAVHYKLDALQQEDSVGVLPTSEPVVVVVFSQPIQLLQGEGWTHAPQVCADVNTLQQRKEFEHVQAQICGGAECQRLICFASISSLYSKLARHA